MSVISGNSHWEFPFNSEDSERSHLVDSAAVVGADCLAVDSIIHVINRGLELLNLTSTLMASSVALPSSTCLNNRIQRFAILSTFESFVDSVRLLNDLGSFGPFVIFAPRNLAFSNLNQ